MKRKDKESTPRILPIIYIYIYIYIDIHSLCSPILEPTLVLGLNRIFTATIWLVTHGGHLSEANASGLPERAMANCAAEWPLPAAPGLKQAACPLGPPGGRKLSWLSGFLAVFVGVPGASPE